MVVLTLAGLLNAQEAAARSADENTDKATELDINSLAVARPADAIFSTASLRPAEAWGTPMAIVAVQPEEKTTIHRFWDRQNRLLFAANGALAATDFFVTRRNLGHSGKELNPLTRVMSGSTPGLAANFALETGGVIGISYLFHKSGHHKLERITSYINLTGSAFAVSYGIAHR